MTTEHVPPASRSVKEWNELIAPWSGPDPRRSFRQLAITAGGFLCGWAAMYTALQFAGLWLALLLAFPTAALLVRLFMIQHDCGHGCYFKSQKAQDIVGFWIGVLTLTPHQYWRRSHAYHHTHSGDLDFRGIGDVHMLTVREYLALGRWGRLRYRLYRNPLVLFGIGPTFIFVIKQRLPLHVPRTWKAAWRSVWLTNLAIVAAVMGMGWAVGFGTFFMIQVPVTFIASTIGVWLFYVQHQFEDTYYYEHKDWSYVEAALEGSTHLVLPRWLQWMTASIGLHHIHHLSSRIPNYRLQECLDALDDLQQARQVTLRDAWRLAFLTLWDEQSERMIRFRDLRHMARMDVAVA